MCGVIGHSGRSPSGEILAKALPGFFHRGFDSAAIVTVDTDGRTHKKDDIQPTARQEIPTDTLRGHTGIAHNRYTTTGSSTSAAERQPFVFERADTSLIFAHNGNIVNTAERRTALLAKGYTIRSQSDSELLGLTFFDAYLHSAKDTTEEKVYDAVAATHAACDGAYSVVCVLRDVGLVAFRDPHGIRPLVVMRRAQTDDWIIASEDAPLREQGFDLVGDVAPGEAVIISTAAAGAGSATTPTAATTAGATPTTQHTISRKQCAPNPEYAPCALEYVYLARPDSVINGISVREARRALGRALGKHLLETAPLRPDCVVPIPSTPCDAAREIADVLGVPYIEGLVKKPKKMRTFILPYNRFKAVQEKFLVNTKSLRGKRVLLVDDSIVRGNTVRGIVELLKSAECKEIHIATCSPPVKYQNVYGISIPTTAELVANQYPDIAERAAHLGVDGIVYIPSDVFVATLTALSDKIKTFDFSSFFGKYITPAVTDTYLRQLER